MKTIKTVKAEGLTLYQDITQIIQGEFKGVAFPKGHVVKKEDIPILLSIGKENLYVVTEEEIEKERLIHEEKAASQLYSLLAGNYFKPSSIKEGKVEFIAEVDGLLKVDQTKLNEINSIGDIAVATKYSNSFINRGEKVAGARVIPLQVEKEQLKQVSELVGSQKIIQLLPFNAFKIGIVTTGSEVVKGLIKDGFTPVIEEKLSAYPQSKIADQTIVGDNPDDITQAINQMLVQNVDMVFCTGGMSVDPDDKTPLGIKQTGATIITHGTPVLPGSMLMLAYKGKTPIVGLPGGVLFSKETVFDLLLPRLMAQDPITKQEIISLGYGGFL